MVQARLKIGPGCQEAGTESTVAGTYFLEVETPGLSVGEGEGEPGEEEDGVKQRTEEQYKARGLEICKVTELQTAWDEAENETRLMLLEGKV